MRVCVSQRSPQLIRATSRLSPSRRPTRRPVPHDGGVNGRMQPVTPDDLTLLDDFFATARIERSNPALVNIEQPADALSYSELHAATIRGARGLVRAGARAGTSIADFVAEGVLLVITMLSILKSGCVVVPLDPSSPAQRLCALLADCSAELAIAARCSVPMLQQKFRSAKDDADHEELHTRLPPLMAMDELLERCEPDASSATLTQGISCLPPSTARSLCHHIYTSGSTGAPKAVSVSHLAMRAYAQEKIRVHGIEPSSRVLVTSAHTWDPCIGDVLSTLAAGEWSRTPPTLSCPRQWPSLVVHSSTLIPCEPRAPVIPLCGQVRQYASRPVRFCCSISAAFSSSCE